MSENTAIILFVLILASTFVIPVTCAIKYGNSSHDNEQITKLEKRIERLETIITNINFD